LVTSSSRSHCAFLNRARCSPSTHPSITSTSRLDVLSIPFSLPSCPSTPSLFASFCWKSSSLRTGPSMHRPAPVPVSLATATAGVWMSQAGWYLCHTTCVPRCVVLIIAVLVVVVVGDDTVADVAAGVFVVVALVDYRSGATALDVGFTV
ncbi:unnamed protein product, partial [Ectocarpus sp. 13 AM-2016]